jgi:hypothetical protein
MLILMRIAFAKFKVMLKKIAFYPRVDLRTAQPSDPDPSYELTNQRTRRGENSTVEIFGGISNYVRRRF